MNGLARGGIIVGIVGSAITMFSVLVQVIIYTVLYKFLNVNYDKTTVIAVSVVAFIVAITIIILGSITLTKKTEALRISFGIVCLVAVFIAWFAYYFPAIFLLLGGILTLCGKIENKN
ncbi:hypothetical protein SHELI_v1c08780 [Spiroplasma helicoides]|uniref:Uncharacterized protein n=1 Tax=Spiroplasma helicoides TaxID=216938 RepID=A0A1B3SLN2_9MOLU|nr:hypothetical protein [Spiroplasma helicoides]AOG60827.1 hypothetical protein SHELI_v1c08780 [Spiroplasma helicoides]